MPSTCKTKDCKKSATYGPPNSRSRVACATHKTDEMECKRAPDPRICLKCDKRSSYGLPGEKPTYCAEHAPPSDEGFVNLFVKMCVNCGLHQATFGFSGCKPINCAKCSKKYGDQMHDLFNPKCDFENCETLPSFGFVNEKARRCKTHIEKGMIDVKNKYIKKIKK